MLVTVPDILVPVRVGMVVLLYICLFGSRILQVTPLHLLNHYVNNESLKHNG